MDFSDTISFLPRRGRPQGTLIVGICAGFLLAAAPLSAAVPPLKPYDQIVDEVMVFFFSDVGDS